MSNDILDTYDSAVDVTITLTSLAHLSARQSDAITLGTVITSNTKRADEKCHIFGKVTVGATAANGNLKFYIARADDHATTELRDGATGTTDAAYSGDLQQLELVHDLQTGGTGNKTYYFSFAIEPPGLDFALVVHNKTQAALHATGSNHLMRYRLFTPQIQD